MVLTNKCLDQLMLGYVRVTTIYMHRICMNVWMNKGLDEYLGNMLDGYINVMNRSGIDN